jgi:hypothetical protein
VFLVIDRRGRTTRRAVTKFDCRLIRGFRCAVKRAPQEKRLETGRDGASPVAGNCANFDGLARACPLPCPGVAVGLASFFPSLTAGVTELPQRLEEIQGIGPFPDTIAADLA